MKIELLFGHKSIPHGQQKQLYILIRISSDRVPNSDSERLPLNISVVLDRSGSMAGEKISYVKQAAQFLVQHLTSADRISVVSYNDAVTTNVASQKIEHKERITQAIAKLTSGGTTNLSGGWLEGCQHIVAHKEARQINRVLLLTDGLANQGITDTERLTEMARQKREEGIITTTMGVGMDFNEDLLTRMATEGGGAFYFIDNPDRTPEIFAEELRDLLAVVAQNIRVRFIPAQPVQQYHQLNTYPTEDELSAQVYRMGDLYNEDQKDLLLELMLAPQMKLGELSLGKIQIVYDFVEGEQVAHHSTEYDLSVQVVDVELYQDEPNPDVVRNALLLEAARAREKAVKEADKGNFPAAKAVLAAAADHIQNSPYFDNSDLQAEHNMLREEAVDMEMGEARYDAYSRKSTTTKAYYSTQRGMKKREETILVHGRLRATRQAIERHGQTPRLIKWKREQLVLDMPILRIGRLTTNDIVIPENEVSERHCQIIRQGDEYYLEDMGSSNGTFANGGKVEGLFRLSAGDVVTVGSWLFMFDH